MKNTRVIQFLDAGRHPYEAEHGLLATPPRRLTTRDVGGIGHDPNADSDSSITGDDHTLPSVLRKGANCAEDIENPFGFMFNLDAA